MDDPVEREAIAADARLLRRVRWRLAAWSGGTTLAALFVLGLALYLAVARSLAASGTDQLEERATALRAFIQRGLDEAEGPPVGFSFGGGASGTFAVLVGPNGQTIGRRELAIPGLPNPESVDAARRRGRDVRTMTIAGVPVRVLSERVDTPLGPLVIQVVGDRTAEERTLDVLVAVLLLGGVIAVASAAGVGALYAERALVPIREALAAQRLALRRQREFAANASHELRTPLAVIRSSVDHLRRHAAEPVAAVGDALEDITAEVDQLTRLVEDLLFLARSDSGAITLARLPVDLGDVAGEAAASLATLAGEREVHLVVDPTPAVVEGDPARLRQLAVILVDNAIRHSPRGGRVLVTVRQEGTTAVLSVEDEGPGIRPQDLPRIFDRFWRAPGAPAGGTGLGLSIASWIVRNHRGTIQAANRPQGGAVFTVRLPLLGAAGPSHPGTA